MFFTPDHHGVLRSERSAHAVRAHRALRPAEPRREAGPGGDGTGGLVAPLGQDPAGGVGDCHNPSEIGHLVHHGGGAKTQLREDNIVFGRMGDLRDRHRRFGQVRVDAILITASMPGDRHFGPYATDVVLALHEAFPRAVHRGLVRVAGH